MQKRLAQLMISLSLSFAGISHAAEETKNFEKAIQRFSNTILQFAHKKGIDSTTPEKLRYLYLTSTIIFHAVNNAINYAILDERESANKVLHQSVHAAAEVINRKAYNSVHWGKNHITSESNKAASDVFGNTLKNSGNFEEAYRDAVQTAFNWPSENSDTFEMVYEDIHLTSDDLGLDPFRSLEAFDQFQTALLSPLTAEARVYLSWLNSFRVILLVPQGTPVLLGYLLDPQSAFSYHTPQNFLTDPVMYILYLFIAVQMQHINLGGGCG